MSTVSLGQHTVETSNEDKLFFPEAGLTKGDLIDYYRRIAPVMLPHVRERPLTLHRYPDGISGKDFYQQQAPDYFPSWIDRVTVAKAEGTVSHPVCNTAAALVYLANQATITLHAWLSRANAPREPDQIVFDLDPSGGDFSAVRATAHPDLCTVEQRIAKRNGRVYLDTACNAYGQTAVAPYSVRARPGASVATPIDWAELDRPDLTPRRYTIRTLFRRLGQKDDPWAAMSEHARPLPEGS